MKVSVDTVAGDLSYPCIESHSDQARELLIRQWPVVLVASLGAADHPEEARRSHDRERVLRLQPARAQVQWAVAILEYTLDVASRQRARLQKLNTAFNCAKVFHRFSAWHRQASG